MERVAKLRKAWPCLVSAGLMLLAFPPFNLGLLVLVALVPWLLSIRDCDKKAAWRSGYCLGFLYGLGQLFWIAQLVGHWVGSVWLGLIPWLLAAAIYALYFGWAGLLVRQAWTRGWPWAIPLAWVGVEVLRSYIPVFAFPWGLIATPLWPYTALIQTARIGSVFFVSAWVVLANVFVALIALRAEYRQFRPLASALLAGGAASVVILGFDAPSTPVKIAVGQPGVDLAFGDQDRTWDALGVNVDAIADQAVHEGAQLLVLPEGIAPAPIMPPRTPFHIRPDLPMVFGGRRGKSPAFQSAFATDGRIWRYADKTRLVIFGEFVPGRDTFPFIAEAFRLPSGDMSAGRSGVQALEIAGLRTGPVICFEALFPDIAFRQALNGARILTVMSVDDWFMDGSAPDQLRAGAVWRAVETGLPAVRSATTGYTMAIDAHGRILGQLPLRKPGVLPVTLNVPNASPTVKVLPVFPIFCGVFALALPWLPRRGYFRRFSKAAK